MFHAVLVFLGFLAIVAAFLLAFLSQRYWFARAWRFAGRIHDPAWRKRTRGALLAFVSAVGLITLIDVVRNMRGTVSRGSWWVALLGLWLSSSIVSYLFIKIVKAAEWISYRVRGAYLSRLGAPSAPPAPDEPIAHFEGRAEVRHDVRPDFRLEMINHSRRRFFHAAGILAGAIPFVSAAYGFASERFRFGVRQVELPIPNLPPGMEGMRITQLSDIHIGSYMPVAEVRRAVGMANELNGDLTVVTGDFLTRKNDPLEDCIAELSKLRAPLGVWGCNGNHEIYAKAEAEAAALFHRYGMKLLRQEHAELRWQGSAFNLIGVDYQRQSNLDGTPAQMLVGAENLVRHDVPNILLSHNPNSFRRAAELGVELTLAGHTHGGQVRVEILDHRWNPAQFLTPYVAGIYRRPLYCPSILKDEKIASWPVDVGMPAGRSSTIYVNRGLGTIGAPIRLGVPPEITQITLRRA
jgi:predicted MPP superfamily phosphohydrolase